MNSKDASTLAKSLAHPVRIQALEILRQRPISPVQLARETDETLGTCSYHLKALKTMSVAQVVGTVPRRGAVEHVYGPVNGRRWKTVRELLDILADA